jgi:hypothetical protein
MNPEMNPNQPDPSEALSGRADGWQDTLSGAPEMPPEAGIDAWCRRHMERLHERAEIVLYHFQARLREATKDLPRSARGRISVRIRDQRAERATPGAFTVEWVTVRIARASGGRPLYLSDYLCKGDGDRYPASAFRGVLLDWQRPLVSDTEDTFAQIRRGVRLVAQARAQYRAAEKHLVELFARPTH